ncbi:MAG: 5-formyltetrahydrofolate cyclo-ligase [Thaumarchaeota archaeon]|nr:5-formyltetrahydrofolate cyclo-ligase [Nitrososphaerota archaeon]
MSAREKKSSLRATLLARRDALSHDMATICEERVRRRLSRLGAYSGARTVALYCSEGSEVPTQSIVLAALSEGRRVCLPRVRGETIEFAAVSGPGDLVDGAAGIREPSPRCEACDGADVAVVPAVGVTREGARLGRGGGHYDRFLAGFGGVSVALAFSVQVVRSVPEEAHDRRVDWVITEDATFGS